MNDAQLQGGYNPQIVGNPQLAVAGANALQPAAPAYSQPSPQPVPQPAPQPQTAPVRASSTGAGTQQPVQPAQLNSLFDPYIGTRASAANPSVLEYYNKATNAGFSNPDQLYQYASQISGSPINSFSQLHAPVSSIAGATVPGSQPTNLTNPNQTIATNAGQAGLSPTDYQNLAGAENPLTQDQVNAILGGLGIPQLQNETFALPQQNTQDLYNQAYGSAGLADLKSQIADITNQINQRKNDYVQAQGAVNENPFLDEATRTGRIARLNDQAGQYINNLIAQQGQLQSLYSNGVSEVNNVVTRHTNDFLLNQQTNTNKLNYLLQQAEQQKSLATSSNVAKALRYLPDYLKAKMQANPQQTFATPNGATYKWDVASGKFVQVAAPNAQQQILPSTLIPGAANVFNPATGTFTPAGTGSTGTGGFPAGAQQVPNSAAAVNNVSGIKQNGQFKQYSDPTQSFNETVADISAKQKGNTSTGLNGSSTLDQFVHTWTGEQNPNYSANDIAKYLQQQGVSGVTANTSIGQIDATQLATAVSKAETGYTPGSQGSSTGNQSSQLLQSYVDHTPDGYQYVDQGKLEGTQKDAITYLARQAGISILNTDEVAKVKAIQASELNLGNIQNAALGFLPSDPLSRIVTGPTNKLADLLQTNSDISAFNAWRSAVINNVQALAGGAGSGLRINQAEIDTALKNDLPEITDTSATAQQKIATLKSQLTTWKTVIFGSQPQANAAAQADLSNLF